VAVDALILQLDALSDPVGDGPPESQTDDDTGTPDIAVAPPNLSFGAVPPGSSAALFVTVSNVGDGDLNVTGVAPGVSSSPAFSVTSAPGLPGTLAPGDMVQVEVTFWPSGTSLETGTLEIASDDPDEAVTVVGLSGSGDAGDLAQCLEDLGTCQASLGDADGDGEVDATDRCPNTREDARVDRAGCTKAQFCRRVRVRDWVSAAGCVRSDWRNDEPLRSYPGDCRLRATDHGYRCAPRYGRY
jgi:hypothetical protein